MSIETVPLAYSSGGTSPARPTAETIQSVQQHEVPDLSERTSRSRLNESTTMEWNMTTRDAGASRTFQSIFGSNETLVVATQDKEISHERKSQEEADDDDAMWDPDEDDEITHNNNHTAQEASVPLPQMQRKSMEEWAEDDDEEDHWKDALQARVDQLELTIPPAAASNNTINNTEPCTKMTELTPLEQLQQHLRSSKTSGWKPRHHTSTTTTIKSPPPAPMEAVSSAVVSKTVRKRTNSTEFASRNIKTLDQKRVTRLNTASRGETARRHAPPSSTIARPVTRSSSTGTSHISTDKLLIHTSNNGTSSQTSKSTSSSMFTATDAEAMRRFVLNDVKRMSIDRIVADAKRLRFLEDFYKQQQQQKQS